MIDVSSIRSPGWQKLVADLVAPAPDDRVFMDRLLRVLCQACTAKQALLFAPDRTDGETVEPRLISVWPRPSGPQATVEMEADTKAAVRAAFESSQSRIFTIETTSAYYDDSTRQGAILAIAIGGALSAGPQAAAPRTPDAVVSLLVEPRSKEALRSTLAMAEVLVGYVHGHGARQALQKSRAASQALDLAARLIASLNHAGNTEVRTESDGTRVAQSGRAGGFRGAAMQFTNDLAREFKVDRVALGWVRSDRIRVEAISDTEHFDRRMAMVQKITSAMEECLDQEQPIVYPAPRAGESSAADDIGPPLTGEQDVLLAQAIVHAHRELAGGDSRVRVCSLPLRVDEDVVGVVTFETGGHVDESSGAADPAGALPIASVELAQAALDLIAPVLKIKRSDGRNVALRAWDSAIHAGAWLVGPRHTAWKLAGVALLALAIFVTFFTMSYRVGATAMLQPGTKRVVSVPFDGQIAVIGEGAGKGRRVNEGDLLIELDTSEWRLRLADARAQQYQETLKAMAARAENKMPDARKAEAAAQSAQAQINLIEQRIHRSVITAPISGVVIDGLEARERIGSTLKLGDPVFIIAPENDIEVVIKVDERDIALVEAAHRQAQSEGRPGGEGVVATRADPSNRRRFVIQTIVPMAVGEEGKNTFEVRGRLLEPAPNLRPGTEGLARIDTQRHSLLWIGTRRILDTIRLWIW